MPVHSTIEAADCPAAEQLLLTIGRSGGVRPLSRTRLELTGAQWLIAALVALGPFSLTMYQPALPSIATSLNITTAQVQLTLTVYLASFAIGQLIYGPMSDHFGRRRTLLLGLAIFVVGATACALANSAAVLIAARVLQGLGACAWSRPWSGDDP